MMNYTTLLGKDSMYNTPPCWCIYMTGLVLKYLENDIGGLANMQKINEAKAKVLYDYLDGQDFFTNPVEHRYRSTMNVTFTSPNADLDKKFCAEAAEAGFVNLKGHRLVGGMRASIYNAMPAEGVDKLVDFMEKFRKANANTLSHGLRRARFPLLSLRDIFPRPGEVFPLRGSFLSEGQLDRTRFLSSPFGRAGTAQALTERVPV